MSNKSPVFPMPQQPQHFSDYGFDPQIDYFQVLEEARKHKRESLGSSIDALQFKLQKPISKEDSQKNKKKKWWRNALLFWRWKWAHNVKFDHDYDDDDDAYMRRNRANKRAAVSGPVYITESRSGSATPSRTSSRPTSGPLAGTLTPTRKDELMIPYLSLRELNLDQKQHGISTSSMPIYLVT